MQTSDFRLPTRDGNSLYVRTFLPEQAPRAMVQIAHGMAEHSGRYARLAEALTEQGYGVFAADHRGHGKSAQTKESLGYFADEGGWTKVVEDQIDLTEELKSRFPGLPVFLLGHSMGSFIARGVAIRRGGDYRGLLLSGTGHDAPAVYKALRLIIRGEILRLGKTGKSPLISKLTFEGYNKQFKQPRTDYDWLSRDPAEVDLYCADPLCGFQCSNQLWLDVSTGLAEICSHEQIVRMPKTLPVYLLAGERDPINNKLVAIQKLRKALDRAKMASVTVRVYQMARHELFNETNRVEVTRDLVEWLNQQLA